MRKRLTTVVVFAAGGICARLVAEAYGRFLMGVEYGGAPWQAILADLLLWIVIPCGGGVLAVVWFRRRRDGEAAPHRKSEGTRRRGSRWFARLVIGGYLLTWIIGVPSAINQVTNAVIEEWSQGACRGPSGVPAGPRLKTIVAFPVLPGFIVLYHDHQISGQNGWGGWMLYAVWGTGAHQIATAWRRMS